MEKPPQMARCVNCRSEVEVADSYVHGDHIKCGACGTQHRVLRGEGLRLVLADVAPLQQMLRENAQRIEDLGGQLRAARASFGIGANGLGIGLIYLLYSVGVLNAELSQRLLWDAAGVALGAGVALELANYSFLAKRQKMRRIAAEIEDLTNDRREIQKKIRDAARI